MTFKPNISWNPKHSVLFLKASWPCRLVQVIQTSKTFGLWTLPCQQTLRDPM